MNFSAIRKLSLFLAVIMVFVVLFGNVPVRALSFARDMDKLAEMNQAGGDEEKAKAPASPEIQSQLEDISTEACLLYTSRCV